MRAARALMKEETFAQGEYVERHQGSGRCRSYRPFGVLEASYLGLRSSDSLQPRPSNSGPSALILPVRQLVPIFGRWPEGTSQLCGTTSCF